MSELAATITALREAVADSDPPANESVDIEPATTIGELEAFLGPATWLPPMRSRPRLAQFNETIPDEGTTGATVLAEVDDDGNVVRVTARHDAF